MVARRLIIALVLSLVGSAIFTVWLSKKFSKPSSAASSELHYVAVAQNVQAGDVLSPTMLKLVAWPSNAPLEGAFPKADAVAGRIVLFPLSAGEPIVERQLAAQGSTPGLSIKIPEGMRAISLKSDPVVGVSGFLLPGTHVDVVVNFRLINSQDTMTSTVLQDAQVIAVGQKMEPDPEGKPTTTDVVTLLVSPEDAEKAVQASTQGSVHFILRNGADHGQTPRTPIMTSALGGAPAMPQSRSVAVAHAAPIKAPSVVAAPKPYTVQMVYGESKSAEQPQ